MSGHSDLEACNNTELCLRPLMRRAFGLFWDHLALLLSAQVVLILILVLGNQLLTVGGNLLLGPFVLGFYKISLRIARNEQTDLSDLLSGFEFFLPAFVANILIHLIAFVASFFLVIPGLLVLLTYCTTYFFILEKNLGFWDAMEASRAMVWGNFKRWLAVGLMFGIVNLAGLLCLGVGLLFTLPITHLLITLAYEEEIKARNSVAE